MGGRGKAQKQGGGKAWPALQREASLKGLRVTEHERTPAPTGGTSLPAPLLLLFALLRPGHVLGLEDGGSAPTQARLTIRRDLDHSRLLYQLLR